MGSTAKPHVEKLQLRLGELPPGITAEHSGSRVIAPAQGVMPPADGAPAYRAPHAGLHGSHARVRRPAPRGAGWRTSGRELPEGCLGSPRVMDVPAGGSSPIGMQGCSPRALVQCA
jgi:hypothetical protein